MQAVEEARRQRYSSSNDKLSSFSPRPLRIARQNRSSESWWQDALAGTFLLRIRRCPAKPALYPLELLTINSHLGCLERKCVKIIDHVGSAIGNRRMRTQE